MSSNKIRISNIQINRIVSQAKNTFNVSTGVRVLERKAFKDVVGDAQRGGTYKYFQDCVFINRDAVRSYGTLHLQRMFFHEFGHAYTARVFAKHRFLPIVFYEPKIEDDLMEHCVRHMWNACMQF